MFELFQHEPVCRPRQLDELRERERQANAEAWQLRKRLDRARQLMAKGAAAELGPLARQRLVAKVNRVLGVPLVRLGTSLEPNARPTPTHDR